MEQPAVHADLADLGVARADLIEAGLLRNPVLSLLFPLGPKQLEFTVKWPVEALWERPKRVAAASASAQAVGERLVEHGLALVAAVRIAYVDLAVATTGAQLAEEVARAQREIADIAEARLAAGDISELETEIARVDAATANEAVIRLRHDVELKRSALVALMGLVDPPDFRLTAWSDAATPASCGSLDALLADALAARPDVRAAEIGLEAAAARAGWERSRIMAVTAMLDANGEGKDGFEMGPGLEVELPIFSQNNGGRARAGAELERAGLVYLATRARVAAELRDAVTQLSQALEIDQSWRAAIVPGLETEVTRAEQAYAAGDTSYLLVLEATRRTAEARLRALDASAEVWRAAARLDQRIGRTCSWIR